ncbi:MAG TPA: radical SAM protein [Candidatus Limnocylindrales bacterium]|nr:radical SAM protein [Candidatus Limnocylindrales bacterium]
MITFGPIPSRRLGRSLGINNISTPSKVCTYSCVYCQLGRTVETQVERRAFYKPEEILKAVEEKIKKVKDIGESIDYLTFVPDGEPTLDINLGREIELLKPLGIRIAVITNASLIWRTDVREDLMKADWVSLKVDSTREEVWRRINQPDQSLRFASILSGMLEFARVYEGELVTETMLVKGVNDSEDLIQEVAAFLTRLRPLKAYLAIPTRPPAEKWVQPPDEETINRAYQILSERIHHVECLLGYEGTAFTFTGNIEEDLLSITSVHPMREDAVKEFLLKAKANWSTIQKLINRGQLIETEYKGKKFYIRKLY